MIHRWIIFGIITDIGLTRKRFIMGRRGKALEQTLYQQIYAALANGETQRDIADRLQCSRVTVHKAVLKQKADGISIRPRPPAKPPEYGKSALPPPPTRRPSPATKLPHPGQRVIIDRLVMIVASIHTDETLRLNRPNGMLYKDNVPVSAVIFMRGA